jgi:hypothetical protein
MATSTAPLKAEEFEELAGRVDRAIAGLQALDAESRTKALAVKDAIEQFHKAGLTKIVHGLKADERGLELLIALAAEPEVYALFSMHGLIRADLPTRVARVIEMARPYIKSHGGDVELDRVEGTTVWVTASSRRCGSRFRRSRQSRSFRMNRQLSMLRQPLQRRCSLCRLLQDHWKTMAHTAG